MAGATVVGTADPAIADAPAVAKDEGLAPSPSPFVWADGFMDVVAKYERNSERSLYVYGISVSRCAYCRHRLKSDATECENCSHVVSTKSKACTRCEEPKPGLWCYECDVYFCEACHRMPHVLVLGGGPPDKHHCYPTDGGSSGKVLRHGAWSSSLMTMAKNARRSQMKLRDDAKARAADEKKEAAKASSREDTVPVEPAVGVEILRADEKPASAERKLAAKQTALRRTNRPPPAPTPTSQLPGTTDATSQPTSITTGSASTVTTNPPARSGIRSRSPSPISSGASAQAETRAEKSRTPSPTKLPPGLPLASKPPTAPTRPDTINEVLSTGPTLIVSRKRKSPLAEPPETKLPPPPPPQRTPPPPPRDGSPTPLPQRASPPPPREESPPPTVPIAAQPSTELSGMSLYLQVREMKNRHFQRQHAASTNPANGSKESPTPSSVPSSASSASGIEQVPHTVPSSSHRIVDRPTIRCEEDGATNVSVAQPNLMPVQPTPVSLPIPSVSAAVSQMRDRLPVATRPAMTEFGATSTTSSSQSVSSTLTTDSDDPLRNAMVERYDLSNIHVTRLEKQLAELNEAVRRASLQDMAAAAKINEHVAQYRSQVRSAEEQRERALAKAIIFSPKVRAFVNSLPREQWMDVPLVLAASHSKCADLALSIRKCQLQLQRLQKDIEDIVSTADPSQLAKLPALGKGIAGLQEQIQGSMSDRDDQFQLMYQFNPRLRELVTRAQMNMHQRDASRQPPT